MEKAIRNNALWIVGFAFLVFGVTVASQFYRTPSTEELRSLGYYRFEEPRQIGSFSLVNQ